MAQKTRNFWWDFGGQEWLGLGEIRFGIFSVTKIQHGLVQKFGENYMENPPSYPVVSPKNVSPKKKMTMFIIHRIFRQRDMKKCRRKVRPFFGSLRELLFLGRCAATSQQRSFGM
jgi:hypothetical protein